MDAYKALITNIFNNATLIEVPFFQRPYVWNEELWAKFIEDMEFVVKTRKPHFLGAIILKDAGQPGPGENYAQHRTVVDGQQRLTTFLLFLKVLCLKLNQPTVFDLQFRLGGQEIALRHGKNDSAAFEKVISSVKVEKISNPKPESRIIEAYNYFIDHVDASKLDIMTIFMNAQFVKIELGMDEDEQQIFDTINSLGVRLTTAELLKNYFFSRKDIDQYNKSWVEIFEKDDETRAYWNQEFEMGRLTRSLIDVFFDSFFQLFVQSPVYKVTAEDKIAYSRWEHLAKSYQDFIRVYCNGNKQVILDRLADAANKFRSHFDPESVNRQMSKQPGMDRMNVIIFGLKTSTLVPYVLYLACEVNEPEEFNKMMGILESYVMRRLVIRATTKNYNNLFVSLILNQVNTAEGLLSALKRIGDGTTYVPSDEELLSGFRNSKLTNLQAKGVIYFIESGMRSDRSAVALLGFRQYSLEHLMPRKWRNCWAPCATEELARERDQKLQTLGNFAIITQSLNTSISDADWNSKKIGKKDNPGLNQCASGLLTMENVLPEEVWDVDRIDTRADWLWEKAKILWSDIAPAISDGSVSARGTTQTVITAELRKRYWAFALPQIKEANLYRGAFSNCNSTKYNFISGYFGLNGVRVDCVANFDAARIDLVCYDKETNKNKVLFDQLYSHKEEIERRLGVQLRWDRAENYVSSWIMYPLYGVSIENERDWPQMAAFHAEWSSKIISAVLSYFDEQLAVENRLCEIAAWTREWVFAKNDIICDTANCNRNYTRFTTPAMSAILPELKDSPSAWGTDTHYFYEIYTMNSGKVLLQMAINSQNITDEFRAVCDEIQKYYPCRVGADDWSYRLPFKTKAVKVEDMTKTQLFSYLDQCFDQLCAFEKDLKQKLARGAATQ